MNNIANCGRPRKCEVAPSSGVRYLTTMANPVTSRMSGTRAVRGWLAVFMALFLVVCGIVHAVAHAAQPVASAIIVASSTTDDSSADGGLGVEATHCQFCGATSVPAVAVTPAKDAPTERLVGPRSYDVVQSWKNSDPPPPKS